jgi:hypothetical protein
VRRSRRSSGIALIVLALAAASPLSAHRRDEYLQAARLAIDPDRVELALDLTPGIAVADQILVEIDRDGSGFIDPGEGRSYAQRVLGAVTVDLDGTPLPLLLVDVAAPSVADVRAGEGILRLRAQARMPAAVSGMHRLRYRNGYQKDVGAYLANALAPASPRVTIDAQRRDPAQQELTIEFSLSPGPATQVRLGLLLAAGAVLVWAMARWRPRPRPRKLAAS